MAKENMRVYLIGNVKWNPYKIGIAKNPEVRAFYLDLPKLPFELTLIEQHESGLMSGAVEKLLHKRFASRRVRGEWFRDISKRRFMKNAIVCYREALANRPKRWFKCY